MSDTASSAFDYCVGSEQKETEKFTTHKWQEVLGTIARDRYNVHRKAALRFLVIPPIFLGLHALLTHLHVRQGVVSLMMVLVVIPLYFFRELMRDVAYRSTAAGMVDLFELDKYDEDDKLTSITPDEFKKLLFEHFTSKKGKKKQRKAAVDKFLTTNTGAKKPLMWLSVICLALVLIVISGPFFGLLFALTFACAILTTIRYFRAVTPPLKKLSNITNQAGSTQPTPEDTEDDTTDSADKKTKAKKKVAAAPTGDATTTYGPTDDELLQMITAYHTGIGNSQDNKFLESFFSGKVPTNEKFKAMLAETSGTTDSADKKTAAADDTRAPLPVRRRHARTDDTSGTTGPTGTPPHGTPVPANVVLSAPVPTSSVPAPAASTTYTTEELERLFATYLAFGKDVLTDEQFAAIEPYTQKR